MSETTGTATAGEQHEPTEKTFTQAELNDVVKDRLARERAKFADYDELKSQVDQFKKAQDSGKTAVEKLSEQVASLKSDLSKKEAETLRLGVIAQHEIPAEYQDLVQGATEEDLSASADKVAALISKSDLGPSRTVIPGEGERTALALNGDGIEKALKDALGINS